VAKSHRSLEMEKRVYERKIILLVKKYFAIVEKERKFKRLHGEKSSIC
jgi:hypothetical protein